MIYWLIPYLVAYNVSDAGNWTDGPEHIFKAEVRTTVTTNNLFALHSNVDINLECRPMNLSRIQCRVASVRRHNWNTEADGTISLDFHSSGPIEMRNVIFRVEFNADGVSRLWLVNAKGRYILDVCHAIFDTVHWGIDIAGKKYGRYDHLEKSMIGSCETTFDIDGTTPSKEEIKVDKPINVYSFDVPAFEGRTGNEPIVIDKNRNVDRCSEKKLYLFDSILDKLYNETQDSLTPKSQVISSRSRIYLGRNSFSGYTRNIGTLDFSSSGTKTTRNFANVDESLHFSLETIRPAKEDRDPRHRRRIVWYLDRVQRSLDRLG